MIRVAWRIVRGVSVLVCVSSGSNMEFVFGVRRLLQGLNETALLLHLGFLWCVLASITHRTGRCLHSAHVPGRILHCRMLAWQWARIFVAVPFLIVGILWTSYGKFIRRHILSRNGTWPRKGSLPFSRIVKLKFCGGRLRCLISVVDISLTLDLKRLFSKVLRWLIRLLRMRGLRKSLILDWLQMVFVFLAWRRSNSGKSGKICFTRFRRIFVLRECLLPRIVLVIY